MAEQVPFGVLRHRGAEVGADAPERGRRLGGGVLGDRQAAHQREAAPLQGLMADVGQRRTQGGQREVLAADILDVEAALLDAADRRIHLVDLGFRQVINPILGALDLLPGPSRRVDDRLHCFGGLSLDIAPYPIVDWHGGFSLFGLRRGRLCHKPAAGPNPRLPSVMGCARAVSGSYSPAFGKPRVGNSDRRIPIPI